MEPGEELDPLLRWARRIDRLLLALVLALVLVGIGLLFARPEPSTLNAGQVVGYGLEGAVVVMLAFLGWIDPLDGVEPPPLLAFIALGLLVLLVVVLIARVEIVRRKRISILPRGRVDGAARPVTGSRAGRVDVRIRWTPQRGRALRSHRDQRGRRSIPGMPT